jgi:hypothetical protein
MISQNMLKTLLQWNRYSLERYVRFVSIILFTVCITSGVDVPIFDPNLAVAQSVTVYSNDPAKTHSVTNLGIGCAAPANCAVSNESNVVSADLTESATAANLFSLLSTHAAQAQLSGPVTASPANPVRAGWAIDTGTLLSEGLLENFTVQTYSGGVLQDTCGNASLLRVDLLGLFGTAGELSCCVTHSFDEVRIRLSRSVGVQT